MGQGGAAVSGALGAGRSNRAAHACTCPDRDLARHACAAPRTDQTSGRAITPLIHVKGYAAPETKAEAERARVLIEQAKALGEPPDDPLLLFSVLYSIWVANRIAFNGDVMRDLAAQFLEIAKMQGTTAPLMIGHRVMGISLLCTGAIADSRTHFDNALALYVPTVDRALATRFGTDSWASILLHRSWASWMLGYPDAAIADADHAVKGARELGHAADVMYALFHASVAHTFLGDYTAASALTGELIGLADQKGTLFWKAIGMALSQGCLLVLSGKPSDAVHTITSGLSAYRSTGSTLIMPVSLSYLASAYANLGKFDSARRCVDEALSAVESTKERWWEAEINRIAGEIVLIEPSAKVVKAEAEAEAYFQRALVIARQQQARSWELRAAMSTARLWRDQGKRDEARDLLAPVYGWFTEGFDTLDLKEAKTLLDELRA